MADLVVLVLICLCAGSGAQLVIDHDGGADDAMAIFEALIYEQCCDGPKVLALTTTHGNVPEQQSFINSQKILDIADRRDVLIYRGSNSSLVVDEPSDGFFGRDGLGDVPGYVQPIQAQPLHAALALIDLTFKHPGKITIVTLGALTNIALAIHLDPGFLSRVSTVYVGIGHQTPYPNYNIYQDVEAYHVVAQNAEPNKVTIVAYSNTINITSEWRKNVLGAIDTKKMQAQNQFERISLASDEQKVRWTLLDPIVMASFLDESVIGEVKYSKSSVVLCGERRGILENNFTTAQAANVKVIYNIDVPVYQEVLFSIFDAEVK